MLFFSNDKPTYFFQYFRFFLMKKFKDDVKNDKLKAGLGEIGELSEKGERSKVK